jgi:hypothetical protein
LPVTEFEIPDIEEIYRDLAEIASMINDRDIKIDVIVGISRGGLIPARLLSDFLLVPEIKIVSAGFYLGPKRRLEKPVIISPIKEELNGKIVLLVDDVADTGETLMEIEKHLYEKGAGKVYTAVIYTKPWNKARVDFYVKRTEAWIIFPWERVETISQLSKMQDWEKVKGILEKEVNLRIIFDKFLIK